MPVVSVKNADVIKRIRSNMDSHIIERLVNDVSGADQVVTYDECVSYYQLDAVDPRLHYVAAARLFGNPLPYVASYEDVQANYAYTRYSEKIALWREVRDILLQEFDIEYDEYQARLYISKSPDHAMLAERDTDAIIQKFNDDVIATIKSKVDHIDSLAISDADKNVLKSDLFAVQLYYQNMVHAIAVSDMPDRQKIEEVSSLAAQARKLDQLNVVRCPDGTILSSLDKVYCP